MKESTSTVVCSVEDPTPHIYPTEAPSRVANR
jgi:hypothetical protein